MLKHLYEPAHSRVVRTNSAHLKNHFRFRRNREQAQLMSVLIDGGKVTGAVSGCVYNRFPMSTIELRRNQLLRKTPHRMSHVRTSCVRPNGKYKYALSRIALIELT